jgi:hypothetical protein
LLIRIVALWGYSGSSNRTFVDSRALNIGLPLLGGVVTLAFFLKLVRFCGRRRPVRGALFLRAGLYGFLSYLLTLQAVFVAIAVRLSQSAASCGASSAGAFLLSLLDVELYGLIVMIFFAPLGFVYGLALGVPLILGKAERSVRAS